MKFTLKEISDGNYAIDEFEKEQDFYEGGVNQIVVKVPASIYNKKIVVLAFENSKHYKFGPVPSEYVTYNVTEKLYRFNINENRLLTPGELLITIYLNEINERGVTLKTLAVGNVTANVIKSAFVKNNILILDDDAENVVMDMQQTIEETNNLVNNINDNILNLADEEATFDVAGKLHVGRSAEIEGALEVEGKITTISGIISEGDIVSEYGNIISQNDITAYGDIGTTGTLRASEIEAQGNVKCTDVQCSNITANGNIATSKKLSVQEGAKVGKFATYDDRDVINNSSSKNLEVNGKTQTKTLVVGYDESVDKYGKYSTYTKGGQAEIKGTLDVGGHAIFNGGLEVEDGTTHLRELQVNSSARFRDDVCATESLEVGGHLEVGGYTEINGTLSVNNPATFGGHVKINNELYVNGGIDLQNSGLTGVNSLEVNNGAEFGTEVYANSFQPKRDDSGHLGDYSKAFHQAYINKINLTNDGQNRIDFYHDVSRDQDQLHIHSSGIVQFQGAGVEGSKADFTNLYRNGSLVATLGSDGKIPSSQLPSYVDDVLEYTSKSYFPSTGETGKIYVDKNANTCYRWSGSTYVLISSSLALGETSSTAYPGDKGKANADAILSLINNLSDGSFSVASARLAEYATKDANGNSIPSTYATKSELNSGLSNKVDKVANKRLFYNYITGDGADFNDFTSPGFYKLSTSVKNSPNDVYGRSSGYYELIVSASSDNCEECLQIACYPRESIVYIRAKNNDNWTGWKMLANMSEIDSLTSNINSVSSRVSSLESRQNIKMTYSDYTLNIEF